MKKIYLFLIAFAFSCTSIFSQAPTPCVVDQSNNTIGLTPNDLGVFCKDENINQDLQIVVPNDTTIFFLGQNLVINFDSIQVSLVQNTTLPSGLEYDCADGCWIYASNNPGDVSRGCIDLYGIPTEPSGANPDIIEINARVYGNEQGFPFEYDYPFEVEIEILPTEDSRCITALSDFQISSALSVYPNPSKGSAYINLEMPTTSNVSIELYDVIGNKIESVYNGRLSEGQNNLEISNASELSTGMYMLKVEIGSNTYTERLMIK